MAKVKLTDLKDEAEKLDLEAALAAAPSEIPEGMEGSKKPSKAPKASKAEEEDDEPKKKGKTKVLPKKNGLQQARQVLNKAFAQTGGSDEVMVDEDRIKESMPHLPTGSPVIDFLIGGIINKFGVQPCPGFPRGRVVNIYGAESSGKTTLNLMAAAEVCKRGGQVCYIDWEHAIDIAYAKTLGFPIDDPDQVMFSQPDTLEKGLAVLWTCVKAGVDLVIVDSVVSGATLDQSNKKTKEAWETGRIGAHAAQWSQFFPKLKAAMARTNSCLVGISQLRAKINTGGYGGGEQTAAQGGQAWKFFSEVRIKLTRIAFEKGIRFDPLTGKNEEVNIGNVVEVKIDKCKVSASQGRKGIIYIRYGEGIDNLRSLIEIAAARGLVKKGGAWLQWDRRNGTQIRTQGLAAFREEIVKQKGAQEELTDAVITLLSATPLTAAPAKEGADEDEELGEIGDIMAGGEKAEEGSEE
jgi:recombination protein RecA